MAKLGEGDARWIVSERADGTNVNQWHWQEKDCLQWARQRLGELFADLPLADADGASVRTAGVKAVDGDCVLNVRKAKLVASYELNISINYAGTSPDGPAAGVIHIPYLAEENADEDPELRVVAQQEDAAGHTVKRLILGPGKAAVHAAITAFLAELRAGVPTRGAAAEATSAPAAGKAAAPQSAAGPAAGPASRAKAAVKASVNGSAGSSTSTFSLEERLYCRPADLYSCFTEEGRVRGWSQSAASVAPAPGGAFSWFGGGVGGEFEALEPPGRLVMRWRFSTWEDGCYSRVELTFEEEEAGRTLLRLQQTGIPVEDRFGHDAKGSVEAGWREQVVKPIRQVFGYGC